MPDVVSLTAELRGRAGKGGARENRRAGRIPAVIYGNKQEPVLIALDGAELLKHLRRPGFMAHVFEINVAGARERVLPREVQHDPVSGKPLHVDFMRFGAETRIHVEVRVTFANEDKAPGLKKGGVLNIVHHTLDLVCSPDAIPESVTVDLAGLELGDVIHADAISLPEGVELGEDDPQATIASIAAPSTEEIAEPAAAEEEAEEAEKTA
ncbi:MAG: 50S ribosomal protein L25/general stress protein Ctc [Bacteroidota bacterium]|jgi:large subunit ribosomal protein L25